MPAFHAYLGSATYFFAVARSGFSLNWSILYTPGLTSCSSRLM